MRVAVVIFLSVFEVSKPLTREHCIDDIKKASIFFVASAIESPIWLDSVRTRMLKIC